MVLRGYHRSSVSQNTTVNRDHHQALMVIANRELSEDYHNGSIENKKKYSRERERGKGEGGRWIKFCLFLFESFYG